jgi:hypothetical protein
VHADSIYQSLVEEPGAERHVLSWTPIATQMAKGEVTSADILDGQYMLVGTMSGLFFIEMNKIAAGKGRMIPLIRNTRFKRIEIVAQYDVLIALSGKHDHVRQYRLSSLRKLIRYLTGTSIGDIVSSGKEKGSGDMYEHLHASRPDEKTLVGKWSSDYIKIVGTRGALQFVIQATEVSVFMGVLFRQDMLLFEWAREPYVKFMKLKV